MRVSAVKFALALLACSVFDASAVMDCKVLSAQIELKLKANKAEYFKLVTVGNDQAGRDALGSYTVVGSCAGGTRKILYRRIDSVDVIPTTFEEPEKSAPESLGVLAPGALSKRECHFAYPPSWQIARRQDGSAGLTVMPPPGNRPYGTHDFQFSVEVLTAAPQPIAKMGMRDMTPKKLQVADIPLRFREVLSGGSAIKTATVLIAMTPPDKQMYMEVEHVTGVPSVITEMIEEPHIYRYRCSVAPPYPVEDFQRMCALFIESATLRPKYGERACAVKQDGSLGFR